MRLKPAAAGGLAAVVLFAAPALAQAPDAGAAEALFKSRCAACHDPNIERAPSRAALGQMSPGQIAGALESGLMAPMATGLSKGDIQMLAAHLGSSAAASASATVGVIPTALSAADRAKPVPAAKSAEWRAYNGNYASTRYSPLEQINKDT